MTQACPICAVIVTYNIGNQIDLCFQSVKGQVDHAVIVDNGSSEETLLRLQEFQKSPNVTVIYNQKNLGIAAALNQGVQYALEHGFQWVLTLDHDSELTPGMVNDMLATYSKLPQEEQQKVGMLVPFYKDKSLSDESLPTVGKGKFVYVLSEQNSGNLVKCKVYRKAGMYDERLFIDYVDHDFCFRLGVNGFTIIRTLCAILLHRLGNIKQGRFLWKSFKYTNHSAGRRYYITRNRLYVWKRYWRKYPGWVLRDMLASVKDLFKILFYEDDKGAKCKMLIRGFYDGFRNRYGELSDSAVM